MDGTKKVGHDSSIELATMAPSDPKATEGINRNDAALWVTYANIILYALCYQLQRPVEPFLVQQLSENASDADSITQTYGRLQAFFSIIQTVGSPLVGILLDRVGIRQASAMVFLASAASYAILSVATDMNLLFYSKIPTALQHAFLVAQATAATSTGGDEAARAQALGRMTTAYTIGATIGPAVGGYLAEKGDLYAAARLAVVGSLLSVLLSLFFLPNVVSPKSTSPRESADATIKNKRSFLDELRRSSEISMRSALWPLLLVKVIGGVAAAMHATALPMLLTQKLGFNPAQLGITMSSSMFAVAAFGAAGMAPLTSMLGASGLAKIGLGLRAILGFVIAAVVSVSLEHDSVMKQVIIASVLHALASHALATGLTTQTTGVVSAQEQGALLGLEHGLFSLARIGGPEMGTALLAAGKGFWLVAGACGAVDVSLVAALLVTEWHLEQKPKLR
jgi:predicted MFS family arabinose efflux permease